MPKTKELDKQVRELIRDRQNAESDLDTAVALIDWLTDIPMTQDERVYKFTSWAAFNDSADDGKFHWKFLKECGLLAGSKAEKVEYEFYKEKWVRR